MSEAPKPSPVLSTAYWLARETGLLRIGWFRRAYSRAYFAYKRHLEDPFDGLVRRRPEIFSGGHILDVGANIGYNSALFLKVLSPGFKIFAFEPDASNLDVLHDTIGRYHAEGTIVPVPGAVGDEDGEAELWRNPSHPGDHRIATPAFRKRLGASPSTARVRIQTIDGFLESHGQGSSPIAFVKIDVQGSEPAVFRGMDRSLARCPGAVVAFEYGPSEMRSLGYDPAAALEFFSGRGYFLYLIQKDGHLLPFGTTALERAVETRGYVDLLGTSTEIEHRPREAP